jgi:hypothetical protein
LRSAAREGLAFFAALLGLAAFAAFVFRALLAKAQPPDRPLIVECLNIIDYCIKAIHALSTYV